MYCIDHVPLNPQGGRAPLSVAAGEGHLPVARFLVKTYHSDVNEEDGKVSGWELMEGVSEHSSYNYSTLSQPMLFISRHERA